MYDITLRELKKGIEEKNVLKVTLLSKTLYNFELDKEYLKMALKTKHPGIIAPIADKTAAKHIDKSILIQAIDLGYPRAAEPVISKAHFSHFDKDIILRTIKTKSPGILNMVGNRANRLDFDREVLDASLATKDANIVRATVDRIVEKSILVEYKEKIQKAILTARDIQSFAGQILSRTSNQSFDREMQETVLDIYLDVIMKNFSKGNMPKDFPMKAFSDSIDQSRYYFSNPDEVNLDSLYQKDRFLVLPVYSYGHAFSAVARKLDNSDKISLTIVNLGARPFETIGAGNQYKEYVYSKKDAIDTIKKHAYNVRLYYPARAVSTDQAYKNFKAKALEEYTVNVTSRDQKVGNCFLKNIEKGVRYALALGLSKTENQQFSPESLRVVSKQGGEKMKVKFLKPVHKPGEKTNELSTVQLRSELIQSLIQKFPEYKKEIMHEWDIYKKRKEQTVSKDPFLPAPMKVKTREHSPVFQNNSVNRNFSLNTNSILNKNNGVEKNMAV